MNPSYQREVPQVVVRHVVKNFFLHVHLVLDVVVVVVVVVDYFPIVHYVVLFTVKQTNIV
jgi:hypothetical protein